MQLNKILRYVCIGGIFLLPVIPYFVSRTMFFPFITGKNFAFRIIVEIVFASWLLLAIRDARYRPRRSILALSIGIFMAVILLADILGVNPVKSLWSNFERMEGFVGLVHLGAYFLAVGAVLGADNLWKKFFHWSFIIASIVGLYGIAQLLGWKDINQGGVRVDATLGNAIYLGVYSLIHIFWPFSISFVTRERGYGGTSMPCLSPYSL